MRPSDDGVRYATEADIPALIELGRAMHAESPRFAVHQYSPAKTAATIQFLIAHGVVLVAEKAGEPVGMMGGMVAPQPFLDSMQGVELAVYVAPAHRGRTGMRLIRAFEAWAFDRGADEITLGISTEVDIERTAALYERLGYRRSGITTIKRREH